ncbi:hypothetical protein DEA8626_01034 [Defluviimonas aquaemixtae]|uniref:PNPLA domain-containing protein n=1 Tax=Albidovulum aquaemixtae TaxID=1542388 RepID=A0A2R8B4H7_9RHOB|nr:patatin-like phospholipase family protein [Defluviimonas aquaemixtae]SPH17511.1 hypothetical protein DEA8626_01034 [Defluviimonas aquaemixtae]
MKNASIVGAEAAGSPDGKKFAAGGRQVALVFQGGGALGAYQAGVYQALHEAGVEPDWIIGTSIGAINAALIAGNKPQNRLPRLEEFWRLVSRKSFAGLTAGWPQLTRPMAYVNTLFQGIPNFFEPNPFAFMGQHVPLNPDRAGYYSTRPLEETLLDLVDFKLINRNKPRLTVGAAHVRSSRMRYFDSRDMEIDVKHILASGALPPAFPAVRVEGELYWDGGILSNTPSEVIFDDNPRRNSLIFAVHLWNPEGSEPGTIWEVLHRHKDVQYSSRVANHIARQQTAHHLRHIIKRLASYVPEAERIQDEVRELESWGCQTQMHVVRLLAPSLAYDDHTKDVDFSLEGIRGRWQAGLEDTRKSIEAEPWSGEFDPLEGVFLHQAPWPGAVVAEHADLTELTRMGEPHSSVAV